MRFRGALWAVPFVTMLAASPAFCQTVRVTLTGSVTDAEGRTSVPWLFAAGTVAGKPAVPSGEAAGSAACR